MMADRTRKALTVLATGTVAKLFDMTREADKIFLDFRKEIEPGDLADEGPSGKSPPDQSASESMEATFSKILANRLYAMVQRGEFDALILIADPDTLGGMRPLLHKEVTDRIVLELDKTLINAPVPDIEKAIATGFGN